MSAALVALLLFLAVLLQVTVAPLFPLSAALPDMVLATLVLALAYRGPRVVMVGLPLAAIWLAFASDRAPGLLIAGYLPLLPLMVVGEELQALPNRSMRILATTALTGLWLRSVLAAAAMLKGADPAFAALALKLLLPGLVLDVGLVAVLYFPLRLVLSVRPLRLSRTAW